MVCVLAVGVGSTPPSRIFMASKSASWILRVNILRLLTVRGRTQADLARALDVTRSAVCYMLEGRRSIKLAYFDKIARFLETTVPQLFVDQLDKTYPFERRSGRDRRRGLERRVRTWDEP